MLLKRYFPLLALLLGLSNAAIGQGANGNGNGPGGLNGAVDNLENDLQALTQQVGDLTTEIATIQADLQSLFTIISGLSGDVVVADVECLLGNELQDIINDTLSPGAILTVSGTCNGVEIRGKQNIHLIGDGSAQISGLISGAALTIASSANIQVENFSVNANFAASALQVSSSSVKLDDVELAGGSISTVIVNSGSTLDIVGIVDIDRLNAFNGIRVSHQSSLYAGGNLAVGSSIPANNAGSLEIRNNSSFTQYDGYVDLDGRIEASVSSNVKIANGDVLGTASTAGFYTFALLKGNSSLVLNALPASHAINVEGVFFLFNNSSLEIGAGTSGSTGGTITHNATGWFSDVQDSSNLLISGLQVTANYDELYFRRNSVFQIFAAAPTIGATYLFTGSGAEVFGAPGYPGLVANCAAGQSVWTNGLASCSP